MKTKYLKILFLLFVVILAIPSTSTQAIDAIFYWTKDPSNPVIITDTPWEGSHLDSSTVMYHDGEYKMWYSTTNGQIGYATSANGATWIKYAGNPVMTSEDEPEFVEMCSSLIGDPEVIFDGTTWKMWYSTGCKWGIAQYYYAISYATSTDGLTWTKYAGNPVFTSRNSWGAYSRSSPSVVYKDGIYHMWYTGSIPGLYEAIGYATSPDGINWTENADDPVIESSSVDVIYHESKYHIWYWYWDWDSWSIRHGTSWDGKNWVDDLVNPALEPGPAGSWDESYLWEPTVLFAEGQMRMWYLSNWQIGYAEANSFTPELELNYSSGSQGSYFTVTATQFPSDSIATVMVNGHLFTETLSFDQDGEEVFLLDTSQANNGTYFVSVVSVRSPSIRFVVAETEPLREQEGNGPIFVIPGELAFTDFVYLPVITK